MKGLHQLLFSYGNSVPALINYYIGKAGSADSPDSTDVSGWGTGTNNMQANTDLAHVRNGTTSLLLEDEISVAAPANPRIDIDYEGGDVPITHQITVKCWFKCAVDVEFRISGQGPTTNNGYQFGTGTWEEVIVGPFTSDATASRIVMNVRGPDDLATYPCYIDDVVFNVTPI